MDFFEWVHSVSPDSIVGHNYTLFDGQFIDTRAEKFNLNSFSLPIIDTLKIARSKKIPVKMTTATGKPSYRQESLADYYNIVYNAHSAIEDVRALIKIYRKMTSKNGDIKVAREKLGF
jgi:DNA polymerase III alpha subunit (gram-positive type)